MRHTMGQDWGGRRKANPENIPKITKQQVLDKAKELGLDVLRGDFMTLSKEFHYSNWGTWWYRSKVGWITLGSTNYIAFQSMERMVKE